MNSKTRTKTEVRKRLFVGIEVPAKAKEEIIEATKQYPRYIKSVVPAERWHLTLFFMGEVRNPQWYMKRICKDMPQAFMPTVTVTHVGRGYQRLQLWAFTQDTNVLQELHKQVRQRIMKIRVPIRKDLKEPREFIPHITVANLWELTRGIGMADYPTVVTWQVDRVLVYSSETGNNGLKYSIEGEINLAT